MEEQNNQNYDKPDQQPADQDKTSGDITDLKHDRSQASFPQLDLSEGEYVIKVIDRNWIGIFAPLFIAGIILIILFTIWADFKYIAAWLGVGFSSSSSMALSLVMLSLIVITLMAIYSTIYIYTANKMFLTNESVIQEIRTSFFTRHEQIVSLANVKDVSYSKQGILQQIANCGMVRLTTEGDDTYYNLSFANSPEENVHAINNAIEVFCKVHKDATFDD